MPLGGGQAGAARPGMSSLLGNQPAFKELWLNEMFSCAKSLLGNVTGQLWGGWAWPGRSAQRCQEGCWGEAWKGQKGGESLLPSFYLNKWLARPGQGSCQAGGIHCSDLCSRVSAFSAQPDWEGPRACWGKSQAMELG